MTRPSIPCALLRVLPMLAAVACSDGGASLDRADAGSDATTASDARAASSTDARADIDGRSGSEPDVGRDARPATRNHLYVATTGDDDAPGSATQPFRTIGMAASVVTPDTTVHVAPGVYPEVVQTDADGRADAPILYVSDVRWGAKIRPTGAEGGAVWASYGSFVTIEGFEIDGADSPEVREGILFAGNQTYVLGNHVLDILLAGASDSNGGAGILAIGNYRLHTGQHMIGNYVHDVGGTTSDHRVHGIYFASTDGSIVNNVIHSTPDGIVTNHDPSHLVIANNTIFGNRHGISIYGGDGSALPTPVVTDYITVINNIVYDNGEYGITEGGTTGIHNVYRNNLVYGQTTDWDLQNGLTHTETVSEDPRMIDYVSTGGGDYRLESTSPAIDRGTATDAPSVDFEGSPRPYGPGIDIGAHEWRP